MFLVPLTAVLEGTPLSKSCNWNFVEGKRRIAPFKNFFRKTLEAEDARRP
jgi:hypothetical protein